jgi:uncharacterized protein (DUF1697 family)
MPSVQRWVAFLRGMNLGRRRITNTALCECFAGLGLVSPSAFLASGNVTFDATERSAAKLTRRIEGGLEEALGYGVPTFLRTAEEVRAIAGHQPFPEDAVEGSRGKLQVLIVASAPESSDREAVLAMASSQDRLAIAGRELYWLPSGGTLESELDLDAIGKRLGLGTMRTRRTVERLAARFLSG